MELKNITPPEFICQSCSACPAVFETENDSYIIIGKNLPAESQRQLKSHIGADEFVIEVPKGMIRKLK